MLHRARHPADQPDTVPFPPRPTGETPERRFGLRLFIQWPVWGLGSGRLEPLKPHVLFFFFRYLFFIFLLAFREVSSLEILLFG